MTTLHTQDILYIKFILTYNLKQSAWKIRLCLIFNTLLNVNLPAGRPSAGNRRAQERALDAQMQI